MSSASPIACVAPGLVEARACAAGDWARLPSAVIVWLIASGLLAVGTEIELRVLKSLGWMWEVITWKGEGAPPGPVTLTFFFFPLMLIVGAGIGAVTIVATALLARSGRRLLRQGSRPGVILVLGLALLLLPFGYAVVASVFFSSGRFAIPTAAKWVGFIDRDGVYVLAPAILIFVGIALLCCIRPIQTEQRR